MSQVELVDAAERCKRICAELGQHSCLAIDLEGVDLGRTGDICIVQIGAVDGRVWLFDVTTLGHRAFDNGLRSLLEDPGTAKLLFDCRNDTAALYHIYGVLPQNVLDMQVLFHNAMVGRPKGLRGMTTALRELLPAWEYRQASELKAKGKALYAPEKGGTLEVWRQRPLHDTLLQYCATDVLHLFSMLDRWSAFLGEETLRQISEDRMLSEIVGFVDALRRARVDFLLPEPDEEPDEIEGRSSWTLPQKEVLPGVNIHRQLWRFKSAVDRELTAAPQQRLPWLRLRNGVVGSVQKDLVLADVTAGAPRCPGLRDPAFLEHFVLACIPDCYLSRLDEFVRLPVPAVKAA
eukprot:TRINITY_DN55462_c0_g1_i1.p1 TRINITY_DN55462_c0_g1~~TRINITY_DN55462_c0_g1_i1.p1  ORF type:complete len:348 (+),score=43.47 TRINITY_DN55462_c0_g1_i1:77-1120(+)